MTFPDGDDFPAEVFEFSLILPVIGNVALKFFVPEGFVGFGRSGVFAAFVSVPEAAVDKDHRPVFRQDDVRLAREAVDILPEAVACAVQHRADKHLGLRVLSFDLRHVPTAPLFCQMVGHFQLP